VRTLEYLLLQSEMEHSPITVRLWKALKRYVKKHYKLS
jgi:hypothetical protein